MSVVNPQASAANGFTARSIRATIHLLKPLTKRLDGAAGQKQMEADATSIGRFIVVQDKTSVVKTRSVYR